MKLLKRIGAVLVAFSMVISITACADTSWVLKYGDKTVSSGLYLSFLMSAYSEAGTKITDTETELFKQKIEEKDVKDWIVERAEVLASQYIAVENKFDEMGLTLSETDQNEINQSMKTEWPNVSAIYEQNGVGEASYKLYVTSRKKTTRLFEHYYSEKGVEPIANADLMVHYKENFASVNVLGMTKGTAFEDEGQADVDKANEELLKMANDFAEKINKGEMTFGEATDEFTHYNEQDEHDATNTEDVISKDEDTRRVIKKDEEQLGAELVKAIFTDAKTDGKAVVASDDTAYYLILRYELDKTSESDFADMRTSVLADLKQEDFLKVTDTWAAETKPSDKNNSAISRYNPKKIKLTEATA